jgi:peptidoglycan hydrolase CwlO-like protein
MCAYLRCVALWLMVIAAFSPTLADAQNLAGSVQAGTSPEQWLRNLRDASGGNWNETTSLSGPMAQILERAVFSLENEMNRGAPCRRAAANLGQSVISDARSWAIGTSVTTASFSAMQNILSLGEKGVVDFLTEKIKAGAKKEIEDFIKGKLAKEKPEVYTYRATKSGCSVVLVAIWDKAAGTYQVFVYGDCGCTRQPILMTGQSIQMRTFAISLRGAVSISINSTIAPVLSVGVATQRSVEANCSCAEPRKPVDPPDPPDPPDTPDPPKPDPPEPPNPPDPPPPPDPPKPERPVTGSEPPSSPPVCTPCAAQQRAVDELKAQLAEIDEQLSAIAGKIEANRAKQQKLQDRITSLQAQLKSQNGTGASSFDRETGHTTSSYTEGDIVRVTVKDANGKTINEYTRTRDDLERIKKEIESLNAELATLKAEATNLEAERQPLQEKRQEITKQLADAQAALEDCLKKCRLAAAEDKPRPLGEVPGLNAGPENPLFQKMILDRVGPLPSRTARLTPPPSIWSLVRQLLPSTPLASAMASRAHGVASRPSYVARPGDIVAFSAAAAGGDSLSVSIIASGGSSGDVFRILGVDRLGLPVSLSAPEGLVLQPLKQQIQAATAKLQTRLQGQPVTAYCLDFAKLPPSAGTLYRVADEKFQQQFAPMTRVLQSARRLADAGRLHPDSNPAAYADSIKQWSLWSRIEKWDSAGFERNFVDHMRKSVVGAKRQWTKDVEQQVRKLIPNRWRDITAVWSDADAAMESAR